MSLRTCPPDACRPAPARRWRSSRRRRALDRLTASVTDEDPSRGDGRGSRAEWRSSITRSCRPRAMGSFAPLQIRRRERSPPARRAGCRVIASPSRGSVSRSRTCRSTRYRVHQESTHPATSRSHPPCSRDPFDHRATGTSLSSGSEGLAPANHRMCIASLEGRAPCTRTDPLERDHAAASHCPAAKQKARSRRISPRERADGDPSGI